MNGDAAARLRDELEDRGFRLEVDGGRLYVHPASLLGEGDRAAIRLHRDGLVALVEAGAVSEPGPEPWPEPEDLDAPPPRVQADAHLERIAHGRRPLMADDGSPSPCTECGSPSLRNGTRLCATCWEAWQGRAAAAAAPSIEAA